MNDKARRTSVSKEDVLTRRGANPRTGIISPFISEETSEGGEENDYVHVRSVQHEHKTATGAREWWRQDALGWSLVERASDHPFSKADTNGLRTAKAVQEQRDSPASSARDLDFGVLLRSEGPARNVTNNGRNTSGFATRGSNLIPPTAQATRLGRRPNDLFQIPRKVVGSARSSSMPTPTKISESIRLIPNSKKTTSRSYLPPRPYAEVAALGFHAYPSAPTGHQYPKGEQVMPPSTVPRPSKPNTHKPCHKDIRLPPPGRRHNYVDPLMHADNPYLDKTYRRPRELLPAHLQTNRVSYLERSPQKLRDAPPVYNNAKNNRVAERRPPIQRVPGLVAVPLAQEAVKSSSRDPTSSPIAQPPSQHLQVPQQESVRDSMKQTPRVTSSAEGTCAARKTFDDNESTPPKLNTIKPVDGESPKSSSPNRAGHVRPLLTVNHIPIKEQQPTSYLRSAPGTSPTRIKPNATLDGSPPTLAGKKSPLPKSSSHPAILRRRRSVTDVKDIWSFLLAFAREIASSLVDSDHFREQIVQVARHAASTLQHTPWAIRTLRSPSASVREYVLAARYVLMAGVYTVVLLGVAMRLGKLVVDIGECFWWPVRALLVMGRWWMSFH
ncbi:MAG: hypothetical protein Q9201_004348 [Fulgogasparrea decipioides]